MKDVKWRAPTRSEYNYATRILSATGSQKASLLKGFESLMYDNNLELIEDDPDIKVLLKPGRLGSDTSVWLIPEDMTIKLKWLTQTDAVLIGMGNNNAVKPVVTLKGKEQSQLIKQSIEWRMANLTLKSNTNRVLEVFFDDFEGFEDYFYQCQFANTIQVVSWNLENRRAWLKTDFDHKLDKDVILSDKVPCTEVIDELVNLLTRKTFRLLG